MERTISFRLNGKPVRVTVDDSRMLLWVLRYELGLTGAKFGCGAALCGACTVIVNGRAVRSCVTPVSAVQGASATPWTQGLTSAGRSSAMSSLPQVSRGDRHARPATRCRPS